MPTSRTRKRRSTRKIPVLPLVRQPGESWEQFETRRLDAETALNNARIRNEQSKNKLRKIRQHRFGIY